MGSRKFGAWCVVGDVVDEPEVPVSELAASGINNTQSAN